MRLVLRFATCSKVTAIVIWRRVMALRVLIIDKLGDDKIMLGSDYPFPLGELEPGKLIESSGLTKKTKEMLLSINSLDWLGLPHNYYEV